MHDNDHTRPAAPRLGRRGLAAAGGLGALLAAGCSPVRLLNDLAPDRLAARDIPYAPGPRHSLDVYAPSPAGLRASGRDGAPTVVFLYGGGWTDGDKASYRFVGASLAQGGAVAVIPDYRLYPQVRYPDFLLDCAQALAWAHAHAAEWGGNGELFLCGHSAGAYNAAMLALDGRWLGTVGLQPSVLRGWIGLAGPYDFLPLQSPTLVSIFGGPDRIDTQPIHHASADAPPTLLAAGADDTTVRPANTLHLAARLRELGAPSVADRIYPGIGHREIIGAMASPLRFLAPTRRDTLAFLGLEPARA